MLKMEYIRSMNANYERIEVEHDEQGRYQYCLLDRGGIPGLLDCSIRNVDGKTYLYFDITSKQTIFQMFQSDSIKREWVFDFFESVRSLKNELYRFLLDVENVMWDPAQIFQLPDKNVFSYLYIPYEREHRREENIDVLSLCTFFIEHVDYNDTKLVDFMYRLYDQTEKIGSDYFKGELWSDLELLEQEGEPHKEEKVSVKHEADLSTDTVNVGDLLKNTGVTQKQTDKKGIRSIFEGNKKRKEKEEEQRKRYEEQLYAQMENLPTVAEEDFYEEEETEEEDRTTVLSGERAENGTGHYLMKSDGTIGKELTKLGCVIGKSKEKADLYLEDLSVSRLHCRVFYEDGRVFLEDLNATNPTRLNGDKLNPYEKRELQSGDEIRCGSTILIYR